MNDDPVLVLMQQSTYSREYMSVIGSILDQYECEICWIHYFPSSIQDVNYEDNRKCYCLVTISRTEKRRCQEKLSDDTNINVYCCWQEFSEFSHLLNEISYCLLEYQAAWCICGRNERCRQQVWWHSHLCCCRVLLADGTAYWHNQAHNICVAITVLTTLQLWPRHNLQDLIS